MKNKIQNEEISVGYISICKFLKDNFFFFLESFKLPTNIKYIYFIFTSIFILLLNFLCYTYQ